MMPTQCKDIKAGVSFKIPWFQLGSREALWFTNRTLRETTTPTLVMMWFEKRVHDLSTAQSNAIDCMPELYFKELVLWAVKVLQAVHDLNKKRKKIAFCLHQAIAIAEVTKAELPKMRARIAKHRGLYGDELSVEERRIFQALLDNGGALQIGGLQLTADAGTKLFRFSESSFSLDVACEVAAIILRDELTLQTLPKFYVPWLVTRPRDHWFQGEVWTELTEDAPLVLEKVREKPLEASGHEASVFAA